MARLEIGHSTLKRRFLKITLSVPLIQVFKNVPLIQVFKNVPLIQIYKNVVCSIVVCRSVNCVSHCHMYYVNIIKQV